VQHGPKFHVLWAINAALDRTRLFRQMDQFRETGLDGVVFHPRFYPGTPPYLGEHYLKLVSDAILHARSIGLEFWIYDENGWPSGTVGGQLLARFPGDAQSWAGLVPDRPERCLAEFEREGKRWYVAECKGPGVDYLNPDLALHFLELTYERYRQGLTPEAFDHVEAFFCDEPEFGLGHAFDELPAEGAIPWTPLLPALFRKRYGGELAPLLPLLFFPGEDAGETRIRFWELLTDVFGESFVTPVNDWCRKHGKLFTAHVKGEEHPLFQVPNSGSCHRFFQRLSLPAIDALERHPSNDFFPRQVSSASRQFGSGRCMAEAFGGAGWGAGPEDLERYLLWLGGNGLTDFVLHLGQYRLDSAAIRDWPPSQPLHLTWRHVYPELIARVRRKMSGSPRPAADVLVIAPYRGIMAGYEPQELLRTNVHNARTYPDSPVGRINRAFMNLIGTLHQAGVAYDVADERTVDEHAKAAGNELQLGKCRYSSVIVAGGSRLGAVATPLVEKFAVKPEQVASRNHAAFSVTEAARPVATLPVRWALEKHPLNYLFLECAPGTESSFTISFASCLPASLGSIEIVFADEIAWAALNGQPLPVEPSEEGSRVPVPLSLMQSSNTLCFRPLCDVFRPFTWLRGLFRVGSGTPFTGGPGECVKTDGPFVLLPANELLEPNLVEGGFPFLRDSLFATAAITLPREVASLRLDGVAADAVRLTVDDRDFGWTWRTGGEFRFDVPLSAGSHRLKIELVPNGYNSYGPRHYYQGDWPVVSPAQFAGVRNFADPDEAPAQTFVPAFHFRRFQLPNTLTASGI
jgi:hypothetical protein